jgi:hypothetical protein
VPPYEFDDDKHPYNTNGEDSAYCFESIESGFDDIKKKLTENNGIPKRWRDNINPYLLNPFSRSKVQEGGR